MLYIHNLITIYIFPEFSKQIHLSVFSNLIYGISFYWMNVFFFYEKILILKILETYKRNLLLTKQWNFLSYCQYIQWTKNTTEINLINCFSYILYKLHRQPFNNKPFVKFGLKHDGMDLFGMHCLMFMTECIAEIYFSIIKVHQR